MIICHFTNHLSTESASIHWHGLELDNDSDGTAVTQDAVLPGQSYTYRFKTFRPGLFWFHSHMLPGNTLFGGMYGVIIIENNIEASLKGTTLPADAETHTLALSDIDFDATGKVGKSFGGTTKTLNELVELCHLFTIGDPGGDQAACGASGFPGATVLVNGQTPDAGMQTPKFIVPSGKKLRLRLLNESISRHFRLTLLNSGDNKLYRIGGQGGLLDNVILEGGTKGTWDTQYVLGEIVIGSGVRADVLIVPSGNEGDIIQLVGNPLPNPPFRLSAAPTLPANYPIAYFQISGTAADTPPAAGDPILAGTVEDIENIKTGPVITLIDPVPAPFAPGSSDETIRLTNTIPGGTAPPGPPGIDNFAAMLDSNAGNGDFLTLPRPPNARYASVGDVLELTVRNETEAVHPYHLHGFSMQPVRMVDNATGTTLYTFDYDEFLDTIDVYGGQSFVFRVRLDDREKICDLSPGVPPNQGPVLASCSESLCGGAEGRWLYHCHILNHGALGMISELTVLPGVDAPPEITCPADIVAVNDPGQCSAAVTFMATATDACGAVDVTCVPPSGSVFPVGTTADTCTATDNIGQTDACSFNVTVVDTEPPQVTCSVATASLWPPNHGLVNVGLSVTATDNCLDPIAVDVHVFSDESEEAPTGDGHFSPDAKDIAASTLRVRSERNGNNDGRVSLIVTTATDTAGNTAHCCSTVVVPHDKSAASIASVNAQAAAASAFCTANNGAAPANFVQVGIGPVVGPKQ
jgi:FtsP/CotA-like multicopper oxidase with cupredoxin domain